MIIPTSAHGKGTSAAAVSVHKGSGSKCQTPITTNDKTAPTSKPYHKPRKARAQRRRRDASLRADSMICN
jgi:hypothetical protein